MLKQNDWLSRRALRPTGKFNSSISFCCQLLGLLESFLDAAHHVEGSFRKMIVIASAKALEALDGVGEIDQLARRTGEDFGHEERLRQEAFDLAGAGDGELVFFRQFVHAQDRDDVLKGLVALQDRLNLTGD